ASQRAFGRTNACLDFVCLNIMTAFLLLQVGEARLILCERIFKNLHEEFAALCIIYYCGVHDIQSCNRRRHGLRRWRDSPPPSSPSGLCLARLRKWRIDWAFHCGSVGGGISGALAAVS